MTVEAKFQSIPLSKLTKPEDFAAYRAALEWDLTEPIVIESKEDFRSTPRWREHLEPYYHQVSNLITFCRRLPVTLLADDVGLGKTISAGLIISELAARSRVQCVLIVCPKLLCEQWQQELDTKFDIPATIAIGRQLLEATHDKLGAVITTYNTARLYLDQTPEDRFQMLILDEAHKLRNLYGVTDPPQVAKKFQKALQDRRFRFVLMLTATPIQNRLWDLYSLVDLLTVARGHQNPFGAPGMFARRFIADDRDQARQLKPEALDEFRSIVYGYMSRVRRGDAHLAFPARVVQMHAIEPTVAELELIEVIREPIQKLNRLAQISILQALASSPDALLSQLLNMARNGTAPTELAQDVKTIVTSMPPSAKLIGLGKLIENLKQQNPDSWRLVVFTTRRETQTTIQAFLEGHGLKVGLINGDSGQRNQETIKHFRATPPGYRVIVSTEAGSEGVNLQVANVLVNFDLPWNPMIVEQRVGRVQRLASEHDKVSIFNIMLTGTFEEYIVGRLMQKLQMAAHAIGDIESLLQGTDVDNDGEGDTAESFEDRILSLVLAALAKRDVAKDVALAMQSIENARKELEREEANINAFLGGMDGSGYVGPRAPKLLPPGRSMNADTFTISAFKMLGANVREEAPGIYLAKGADIQERFCFSEADGEPTRAILYNSETPAFQRLVKRCIASGMHNLTDADPNPRHDAETIAHEWGEKFQAIVTKAVPFRVRRFFTGSALVRVRATVAHDAYERLIDVPFDGEEGAVELNGDVGLAAIDKMLRDPASVGVESSRLLTAAQNDDGVAEFCRFYEERRTIETQAAGEDARRRKKLEDEFTPRLNVSLVGLNGTMQRDVQMHLNFGFPSGGDYQTDLTIRPGAKKVVSEPRKELCAKTGAMVPEECLDRCDVTGTRVLKHLLEASEVSGRHALPEFMGICSFSGKRVLQNELETSDVTGKPMAASLMKRSVISGKRGEPDQFSTCAFTGSDVLNTEIAISQVSGKKYRADQEEQSGVSGRTGHRSEFIPCHETKLLLTTDEAEICDVTGFSVRRGLLQTCEISGKRTLASLLVTCAVTGKRVMTDLTVISSISGGSLLKSEAVGSIAGKYCLPSEAKTCMWSNRRSHPDDVRLCRLTGLQIYCEFTTGGSQPQLLPLHELLMGIRRNTDREIVWPKISARLAKAIKNDRCKVEAAIMSPTEKLIATCAETRALLGFRVHQIGAIYNLADDTIIGRIAEGKRGKSGWVES